ncbi:MULTISPECIES: hypothetical protein [Streptomyces]|uniref:Uncharacterized protein n=1 Tax=Streptomyces lutosisoli TaxID=2665721 RepID=A0ABW2VVT7_9ACTN|nr:hypothetical protein [Streptomyces sp. NBC_00589]WTI34583.1 hypothetical protein OIC96_06050 [Streptomyces sp. NBC_00775]WUB31745.1 hypothetical protein OHA51_43680 [Streptomyces sp. NBC_00589]
MSDTALERRAQRLEDIGPDDSFDGTTSYTDKPARVQRVINNGSEDQ